MKGFFSLFFVSMCSIVTAQNVDDKILWKQDGLTWEDFKAQPDPASKFHANTNAGLSFSWGLKNDNGAIELTYEVIGYFNPYLSWVKSGSDHEYLLRHEQLHFDITELHARKLRKKLAGVNPASLLTDPKGVLNRIYQEVEKERKNMQLQFDKDSRHSIDKEGEARWQKFVRSEMLKYEEINS